MCKIYNKLCIKDKNVYGGEASIIVLSAGCSYVMEVLAKLYKPSQSCYIIYIVRPRFFRRENIFSIESMNVPLGKKSQRRNGAVAHI